MIALPSFWSKGVMLLHAKPTNLYTIVCALSEVGLRAAQVKFDVLLTSYEMVLADKGTFLAFGMKWPAWQAVIIDEAHRLKSTTSATRQVVVNIDLKWLLLLTGASSSPHGW